MIKVKFLQAIKRALHISKSSIWFLVGFSISGITLLSIVIVYFQSTYADRAIPGIFINDIYVGEMNKDEIMYIYEEKNKNIGDSSFTFIYEEL